MKLTQLRKRPDVISWPPVPDALFLGSHFTSAENWERIEVEGLRPYPLKREFDGYYREGVLVWVEPHDLDSEIGTATFQGWTKRTTDVVQLAVGYTDADVMPPKGLRTRDTMTLYHDGNFPDGSPYHVGQPFQILQAIPPERVWLVACYHVPGSPV